MTVFLNDDTVLVGFPPSPEEFAQLIDRCNRLATRLNSSVPIKDVELAFNLWFYDYMMCYDYWHMAPADAEVIVRKRWDDFRNQITEIATGGEGGPAE